MRDDGERESRRQAGAVRFTDRDGTPPTTMETNIRIVRRGYGPPDIGTIQ